MVKARIHGGLRVQTSPEMFSNNIIFRHSSMRKIQF